MSETRGYRKVTAQQNAEPVLASLCGARTIIELCREHDISDSLPGTRRPDVAGKHGVAGCGATVARGGR